jgi:hypothetical protein
VAEGRMREEKKWDVIPKAILPILDLFGSSFFRKFFF